MTTQAEALETQCCVDPSIKCVATGCMGWRWYHWKSGMAAPANATHSGPTQRLVIDGQPVGYCGRAGPGEYN